MGAKTGDVFVGKKAWAYGWGGLNPAATEYPDKLMKIELPIVSDEQCQSEMTEKGWGVTITEGMLCAGGIGGEDSCGGYQLWSPGWLCTGGFLWGVCRDCCVQGVGGC